MRDSGVLGTGKLVLCVLEDGAWDFVRERAGAEDSAGFESPDKRLLEEFACCCDISDAREE